VQNANKERLDQVNFEFAKRFVSEKLLTASLSYVERNPVENFPKLLNLGEKIALRQEHKDSIKNLKKQFEGQDSNVRKYIERIFQEINPEIVKKIGYNFFINATLMGIARQRALSERGDFNVPNTILIDPTSACNLKCTGCWAGAYTKHDQLEPELIDRVLSEAKELGIYWIVVSGGEPFLYPYLFDITKKHNDMAFMIYTNGTRIDEKTADKLLECKNMVPCFSLEGGRERTNRRRGEGVFDKVMAAMDRLHARGLPFGTSITLTAENIEEVVSDEFVDFLIEKGVLFGWTFHYIPIGIKPDLNLMVPAEQRAYLAERIPYIRRSKPILIADFWNDGELTQGCIAGGRRYFHINARGDVEPCAFVHFAVDNIREKSLKEVLASPFFKIYQAGQPFCDNHLCPCPIIDNPQALRDIVRRTGAQPTHEGAETVIQGEIAAYLNQKAETWRKAAAPLWEKRTS